MGPYNILAALQESFKIASVPAMRIETLTDMNAEPNS